MLEGIVFLDTIIIEFCQGRGIELVARYGLIANVHVCPTCNQRCTFSVYNGGIDGYRWRCQRDSYVKSVRVGSFFQRSHLPLDLLMKIIVFWAKQEPQKEITRCYKVTEKPLLDWYNFLRDVAREYLTNNPYHLGGFDDEGKPRVVEIDESKYFHRKYHRGQWRDGHWVFGAIERDTGTCIMQVVPDRTAATLTALIAQWLLPGTRIMSDGWAAYANLSTIHGGIFQHDVVIHEANFVNPNDRDVHTNNVENMWMRGKRQLKRMFGTSDTLFPTYLVEFMWRERFKEHQDRYFECMVHCIRQSYPVPSA